MINEDGTVPDDEEVVGESLFVSGEKRLADSDAKATVTASRVDDTENSPEDTLDGVARKKTAESVSTEKSPEGENVSTYMWPDFVFVCLLVILTRTRWPYTYQVVKAPSGENPANGTIIHPTVSAWAAARSLVNLTVKPWLIFVQRLTW